MLPLWIELLPSDLYEPDDLARWSTVLRLASDVHLSMQGVGCHISHLEQWLQHMMAVTGRPLSAVTDVRVTGLQVPSPLPQCIIEACPNLTALEVELACDMEEPDRPTPMPPCHQLQQLSVLVPKQPPAAKVMQQCLKQLPGLTSLALWFCSSDFLWQVLAPVSSQLTKLEIHTQRDLAPLQQFTQLQHIHLWPAPHARNDLWTTPEEDATCMADSPAMAVLLGMPSLKQVHLRSISLDTSFAHTTCNWDLLSLEYVANLVTLARLPQGIQRLELGRITISSSDTPAEAAAALQAVSRSSMKGRASLHAEAGVDTSMVLAALPIAMHQAPCKTLWLGGVKPVTPALVTALSQVAPAVTQIGFGSCIWEDDAMRMLLHCLPATVTQLEIVEDFFTEAQLTELCCTAPRAIHVFVQQWQSWAGLDAGWQRRLHAAIAAAGQADTVTLVVHTMSGDPDE